MQKIPKLLKNTLAFILLMAGTSLAYAADIWLQNIQVVDVINLDISEPQTVILADGKIKAIEAVDFAGDDKEAVRLDMSDKFLVPGLIDTHVHHATNPESWDNRDITHTRLRNLLRGGVTSVRDMGGDVRVLAGLKRDAEIDVIQSPDIYYSVILGGRAFFEDPRTVASAKGRKPGDTDWMKAIDAETDLDQVMQRAIGAGASGIKMYARLDAEQIAALARAAEKHDVKVWSHMFVGPARPVEAVKAGVETLSHVPDISAHVVDNFYELRRQNKLITPEQLARSMELSRYDDLFATMKQQDTILDATLTVFLDSQRSDTERTQMLKDWGSLFINKAHASGIRISTGTDGTSDSHGRDYPLVFREMQLLAEHTQMTPLEILQAATWHGAQVIGIENRAGSVTSGKQANLLVLNTNPADTADFKDDIAHVIKNGKFIYRGNDPSLPFVSSHKAGGMLWMSGQLGNLPSTKTLAGPDITTQMTQTMENIGQVLQENQLDFNDVVKCTLMLADISEWQAANEVYKNYFTRLPARSAFATNGLALGAKVEVECLAEL